MVTHRGYSKMNMEKINLQNLNLEIGILDTSLGTLFAGKWDNCIVSVHQKLPGCLITHCFCRFGVTLTYSWNTCHKTRRITNNKTGKTNKSPLPWLRIQSVQDLHNLLLYHFCGLRRLWNEKSVQVHNGESSLVVVGTVFEGDEFRMPFLGRDFDDAAESPAGLDPGHAFSLRNLPQHEEVRVRDQQVAANTK